MVISRKWNI